MGLHASVVSLSAVAVVLSLLGDHMVGYGVGLAGALWAVIASVLEEHVGLAHVVGVLAGIAAMVMML